MPPHTFGPGADGAQWAAGAHHAPFLFPFFGGLMFLLFLLLVIATVAFLRRGGQLPFGPPAWARRSAPGPEHEARSILATRFATGDLSSEEFLERASALNWTPGVEPVPVPRKRRRAL